MTNVVALNSERAVKPANHRTVQEWSSAIAGAWQKQVSSIIETGKLLIEAKEDLGYGNWLKIFETDGFPFTRQTAFVLQTIAEHDVISNVKFTLLLPASWDTLYECTKLPEEQLRLAVRDGVINRQTTKKDVVAMRHNIKRKVPKADKSDKSTKPNKIDVATEATQKLIAAAKVLMKPERAKIVTEITEELLGKSDTTKLKPEEIHKLYVDYLVGLSKQEAIEELKQIIRKDVWKIKGWNTTSHTRATELTDTTIPLTIGSKRSR